MLLPSRQLLEEHFSDLKGRSVFTAFIEHMRSGPVVCMVRLVLLYAFDCLHLGMCRLHTHTYVHKFFNFTHQT